MTTSESPDLAAQLQVRFGRITRFLRRAAGPTDLGAGGISALAMLMKSGPMRASALAEAEAIAPASITRVVNTLEAYEFVRRTPDPSDGRAQLVEITERGREMLLLGHSAKVDALRARLAALTPEERASLEAALPALDRLAD